MNKILNYLLFAGCDRNEVKEVQNQIDQENLKQLHTYLLIAFIYLTAFLIYSLGNPALKYNRMVYMFSDSLIIIVDFLLFMIKKKSHFFIVCMTTFFQCACLFNALLMKIICHPDKSPLMLIAFGMIIPMLIIDKPWKVLIIDISIIIILTNFKEVCPWYDLRDVILYFSAGYFISLNVIKARIERFIYENKANKVAEMNLKEKENELKVVELNNIISQMKPHFIYNTLATISALCDYDPQKAKSVTNDFSSYLRTNIKASMSQSLIPLADELAHVNTYVNIQKARFDDLIEIEYQLDVKGFKVPPLSIQPIVENAIKHGIFPKEEGVKVSITTVEDEDNNIIIVEDNGVGFDVNQEIQPGHLGLENIKTRVQQQCNGKVEIESTIGKGTKVTVYIPKIK